MKNGASVTFKTFVRNNTLFLNASQGFAVSVPYSFKAIPGGKLTIDYKGGEFKLEPVMKGGQEGTPYVERG